MKSNRFPLLPEWTGEFDRVLRRHRSEVRDYTRSFHVKSARRGVTTIKGTGWAVRPFFLSASRLDFIAATLNQALSAMRHDVRRREHELYRLLPYRRGFEHFIDVPGGLLSPTFLSHLRPDGFLFEDRYVLSELNYGNGVMVSCGYTEAVHDYWLHHPVLKRLGWDVNALHPRPFPRLLNVIERWLSRPVAGRPLVALLAHSEEWKVIESYPKRVIQQFEFAIRQLRARGIDAKVVTEQQLGVDRRGRVRMTGQKRPVSLVMMITVGSSFIDNPDAMLKELSWLRGPRAGDTWLVKPLAGLLFDKGALPLLGRRFPVKHDDGFRFEVAATEHCKGKPPSRWQPRQQWVIKRAFDGKDTHVGGSSSAQEWREISKGVAKLSEYVAQRYVSMPRCDIPVFVDEEHLEFVPSRVELSTFIFDGAFGGAAARHAPDAEGLVMTDPPPDYGFSTVFSI